MTRIRLVVQRGDDIFVIPQFFEIRIDDDGRAWIRPDGAARADETDCILVGRGWMKVETVER